MHVREKKNSAAPAAKQSDMVGVERAWPVLFWVAGVLGFVLPKRQPSGHYRTSWVRLFPMVTITPLMCWFIFTYQVLFTNNSYDQVVDLLTYSACASLVAFTFALAIYKRRETCILFEGLSGKLKPAGKWVSLACSLLLLLDVGLFLLNNYSVVDRIINLPILGWFTMTMIYPVLPLLVDLHVAHSVRALNQVYAGTLSRILPGGSFSSWTRGPVEGLPVQVRKLYCHHSVGLWFCTSLCCFWMLWKIFLWNIALTIFEYCEALDYIIYTNSLSFSF